MELKNTQLGSAPQVLLGDPKCHLLRGLELGWSLESGPRTGKESNLGAL